MHPDYLIIGAGVVGLATAWHLKRLQPAADILVLEQYNRPCSGNSGRSAALYRNLFASRVSRDLAESSILHYLGIGGEIALKPSGYLWYMDKRHWLAQQSGLHRLAHEARGVELLEGERLAAASALAIGGAEAGGAVFGSLCGSLSAQALADWYARAFVEAGGRIQTGVCIAALETGCPDVQGNVGRHGIAVDGAALPELRELPDRVVGARDSAGRLWQAGRYLVAAGCWSQDLLGPAGIASAIYPKKRQLFAFALSDPALVYGSRPEPWPVIILPFGGVYLKPVLERGLMVAGRADGLGRAFESPYGPAARDRAEPDYFRAAIEPVLRHFFPALHRAYPEALELKQAWAGHYDYHWPDMNPVVERYGNLVWAGGSSGSGIMKGDAIGRVAAAAALDLDSAELADGRPFAVRDLSLRHRAVDQEPLII